MLNKMIKKDEKGFTLIELMIVIAIIGILAAIAIPQFASYRTRSYNAASKADIRNAATAQEAYYIDADTYTNLVGDLTGDGGFSQTENVAITFGACDADGYIMTTTHSSGDKTYTMNGPGGLIVETP